MLLNHYLANAATELNAPGKTLNSDALDLLQSYDWPGNVRQLVNTARRLTVTAPGNIITGLDIKEDLGGRVSPKGASKEWTVGLERWAEQQLKSDTDQPLLELAIPELEKTLIRIALKQACGGRQEAARILGWGRNTLTRKIRQLEME